MLHYREVNTPNWLLFDNAARSRDIQIITLNPHLVSVECTDDRVAVWYEGKPHHPDVVLHRTVAPFQTVVVAALTVWQETGVVVLNPAAAAYATRDKLATTLALRHRGVAVVPTLGFVPPLGVSLPMVGDGQVVIKPTHGLRGEGVSAFASADRARRDWDPAADQEQSGQRLRATYLAQPLVGTPGTDLRAFVIGAECVALMRRRARPGEFRANIALGGSATPLPLDHPAASVAVNAVDACEVDYAGVDMVEDVDGTVRVLEVDAWAGFAEITAVTGVDVAGLILDLAVRRQRTGEQS
jgi:ribosomal protein S6--L-glutamate ligase